VTEPKTSRRRWHRIAQIAVTAVFVGFLIWTMSGRWDEVKDVIGNLTIRALILSLLASLVAIWCSFMSWRAVLADFGHAVPVSAGLRIFFVGQLAKYLPGKVWPVLTQMRLGRAYNVDGRSSAAAVLIAMLMGLGTALLVAACCLPVLGDEAFAKYWWILLVLPLAIAVLWPPVLNSLLNKATKLLKRQPMPEPLTAKGIARSASWSTGGWLMFGVMMWVLLLDLGAAGPDLLVRAIGAYAGSWAIGFLLAIAPAGVGPREVALVVLLGPAVGEPTALVAAVVSRLLMTIADLIWPGIAVLSERWRRRSSESVDELDTS
jgi:uncharacterized membrane protein YbhN (UPF0104 family)